MKRVLCVLACIAGCGDENAMQADGGLVGYDAPAAGDAPPDASPPTTCSYVEAMDATNATTATAEATGATFAASLELCGRIDNHHFVDGTVDADAFRFTVANETDVVMHLSSSGAAALQGVVVELFDASNQRVGLGRFEGSRATLASHLVAGTYTAVVSATNTADIPVPLAYSLRIVADAPLTRCPVMTGTGVIGLEQPADNDVILWSESATPQASFTPSTTDAPHPTVFAVGPAGNYRLAGTIDDVDVGDDYMDRDTWQVARGGATNQVSLFVSPDAASVDFDLMVFRASTTMLVSEARHIAPGGAEMLTFATAPSTTYWVWIGARDGATGLPQSYSVRVCAEAIAP